MDIHLPKPLVEILSDASFDNFTLMQLSRRLQYRHGFTQPITIRTFAHHAGHFILRLADIGILKITKNSLSSEGVFCKTPLFHQAVFNAIEIAECSYTAPDHPMEQLYKLIQQRHVLHFDLNSKFGELELYEQLIHDSNYIAIDNSGYMQCIKELAHLSGKIDLIDNIFTNLIGIK